MIHAWQHRPWPGHAAWLLFILLIMVIMGACAKPDIDVVVPPGSSRELDIRSGQYARTLAKYALDDQANSQDDYRAPPAVNAPGPASTHPQAFAPDRPAEISKERRLALVIGNSNYLHGGSLANPANDARAMARLLRTLQFQVITREDVSLTEMKRAIDLFGKTLAAHDVSLFYYSGHGVQVNGSNYLIPIDADMDTANDVEYNCVHAGRILAKMEGAGCRTNIVILDACRDNPFERSWARGIRRNPGGGLAFMNAPSGSLIAYATSPGSTAADGIAGENGVYTAALLRHMPTPGITIEEMFKQVRVVVERQSNGRQTPWESTSLKGRFYFKPK